MGITTVIAVGIQSHRGLVEKFHFKVESQCCADAQCVQHCSLWKASWSDGMKCPSHINCSIVWSYGFIKLPVNKAC